MIVNPKKHKELNFEMILFHGASPYGEEHPAMINLALALAISGIKVYIPRLPELAELKINDNTIKLIVHFFLFVKSISNKNIVPSGISLGGGLLIKAILDKKIKNKLPKSILTYGTYYSIESCINFLSSGKINNNGNCKYIKPHDWGLILLFHNYIKGIKIGFDIKNIQKVLKLRVLNKINESEKLMQTIPDNEKKILLDIFNSNQTKQIQKLIKLILKKYKKEMDSISPCNICEKLNIKIFLLHGSKDSMVPYTESIKLFNKLKKSSIFISGLYEHRELSTGNSLFKKSIEFFKMSSFITKFMDYNGN